MEWQLTQLLIICPLIFIAGLIDAIGGGGGLISLPAFMIAGFPVHYAIGTNKVSSAMGTSIALTRYLRDGFINLKLALCGVIFAMIGSPLGTKTALLINENVFKFLMLFILPLTGVYIFKSKKILREKREAQAVTPRTYIVCSLVAFFLGFYDGLYGPGAGTFMLISLAGVARLRVQEANGVTKAINFVTNFSAMVVYLLNGKVILSVGIIAGVFCIAGNYIGAKFFERGGARAMFPVILVVLGLFFIRVIYDLILLF